MRWSGAAFRLTYLRIRIIVLGFWESRKVELSLLAENRFLVKLLMLKDKFIEVFF